MWSVIGFSSHEIQNHFQLVCCICIYMCRYVTVYSTVYLWQAVLGHRAYLQPACNDGFDAVPFGGLYVHSE